MNKIFSLCFIVLNVLNANSQITKEAVFKTASFVIEKDSLLNEEYLKLEIIEKKGNKKQALEVGLQLIDRAIREGNYLIAIKTNFIVGEIFSKGRD